MTVTAAVWVAIGGLSFATAANAAVTHFNLHIPREPLDAALRDLAHQTGVEVGHFSDQAQRGLLVGPIQGSLSPADALGMLLHSTGLSYRALSDRAYIVATPSALASARESAQGGAGGAGNGAGATNPSSNDSSVPPGKEGKAGSSTSFRMARAARDQNQEPASMSGEQATSSGSPTLEEIVVTAEKRAERLQDVPIPMSSITASSLTENDEFRLQDYYSTIPGLNIQFSGSTGAPSLSIRGITTGGQSNPSVGVTVDDVPVGASTFIGGGYLTPDIDPSDLSGIEVLRGPQGTLYGASSIGGLLRYITIDPTTSGFSGRVAAGLDDVYNGAEMGYSMRGAANMPIGDTVAVRASAFTRLDPGYIDNVQTGQNGVNWANVYGGYASALWQPSEQLSIKLSALLQNNESHGAGLVNSGPGYGEWQQSYLRGTGGYDQRFQLYAANIKAKLGRINLTSTTGYGTNSSGLLYDVTAGYGFLSEDTFPNTGATGAPYHSDTKTDKVSEEIRLSASLGRIDWLLGAFYTHESSSLSSYIYAENPDTGAIAGQTLYFTNPSTYSEIAGFLDMTLHITEKFDIQVGGRQSSINQSNNAVTAIPAFYGPNPVLTPKSSSTDRPFTYLFTPRYRISDDVMVYTRLASGYRPGGPNANALVDHFPPEYNHDTTENYDLGLKADLFGHKASVDAAVYYIDWKNVQVTEIANNAEFIGNGGGAKSEGAELAFQARPLTGLSLSGWLAYNDAELTKALPPQGAGLPSPGLVGARLPFSSKLSGDLSIEQGFPLFEDTTGFVSASENYVGRYFGDFPATPPRPEFSGYWKTDLHAGARSDSWDINLYANNVTNRRAILDGGADFGLTLTSPDTYIYLQPRTVGVSAAIRF